MVFEGASLAFALMAIIRAAAMPKQNFMVAFYCVGIDQLTYRHEGSRFYVLRFTSGPRHLRLKISRFHRDFICSRELLNEAPEPPEKARLQNCG